MRGKDELVDEPLHVELATLEVLEMPSPYVISIAVLPAVRSGVVDGNKINFTSQNTQSDSNNMRTTGLSSNPTYSGRTPGRAGATPIGVGNLSTSGGTDAQYQSVWVDDYTNPQTDEFIAGHWEQKKVSDGTKLTVYLSGRLDAVTAMQFDKDLSPTLANVTDLTIDLADLEYISSAGLRTLLKLQKRMDRQGSMKICNIRENVREVLDMTGFSDFLTLAEDKKAKFSVSF